MKGIILAAGNNSRLFPTTQGISKHLLQVYDKPMIYYPLSVLMLAGIREISLIINKKDETNYKNLLGDGEKFGIKLEYFIQDEARGIAEAFLIAEKFIGKDNVALILGDNIFYGYALSKILKEKTQIKYGAEIFIYKVKNPENYGIVELDENNNILSLSEKPKKSKSHYAVTGLYFYDNSVIEKAKNIEPSIRGELEITDINKMYLKENKLRTNILGRGHTWFDVGTPKYLLQAANFIESIQERQGFYVACLEEIAFLNSWIKKEDITKNINNKFLSDDNDYFKYINNLGDNND